MDPFAGLQEVKWGRLTHAYGSAEDVPALLRQLLHGPEARRAALYELHGNIWHQGTTYEATASAVPFLARLATSDPELAPELLFMLGEIGDGVPAEDQESAVTWTAAAREAVRAELPGLVGWVRSHLTRSVIAGFCRLAYAFPEERALLREPLDEAFRARDVTPLVQAAVVMALLRGGGDENLGEIVLVDVLTETA